MPLGRLSVSSVAKDNPKRAPASFENVFDEETGVALLDDTDEETAKSVISNWPSGSDRKMKGWKKLPNGEYQVTYYIKK
jgi:hypothetical protein